MKDIEDKLPRINKVISKLSKIQIELMYLKEEEYNHVSELLTDIKEYLVNCNSYNEDYLILNYTTKN